MKLYEILNEKYLGRRFEFLKDGMGYGVIKKIAVNEKGQYGWVYDKNEEIDCCWSLREELICNNIRLKETEEEMFNKLIEEQIEITKDLCGLERKIVVKPNCKLLNTFKSTHNPIYIKINDKQIGLSFDEFELISFYVERLKEFR